MGIKFGEYGYEIEGRGLTTLSVYFRASNGQRIHTFDMCNKDALQLAKALLEWVPGQGD